MKVKTIQVKPRIMNSNSQAYRVKSKIMNSNSQASQVTPRNVTIQAFDVGVKGMSLAKKIGIVIAVVAGVCVLSGAAIGLGLIFSFKPTSTTTESVTTIAVPTTTTTSTAAPITSTTTTTTSTAAPTTSTTTTTTTTTSTTTTTTTTTKTTTTTTTTTSTTTTLASVTSLCGTSFFQRTYSQIDLTTTYLKSYVVKSVAILSTPAACCQSCITIGAFFCSLDLTIKNCTIYFRYNGAPTYVPSTLLQSVSFNTNYELIYFKNSVA